MPPPLVLSIVSARVYVVKKIERNTFLEKTSHYPSTDLIITINIKTLL
jgi:hypothetical protein